MNKTYELWDVEAGNIIGDFSTAGEALEIIQTLLDAYGSSYADELNLSEREGTKSARIIGAGRQLVDMPEHRKLHGATRAD